MNMGALPIVRYDAIFIDVLASSVVVVVVREKVSESNARNESWFGYFHQFLITIPL
jgi:hypothetical protein